MTRLVTRAEYQQMVADAMSEADLQTKILRLAKDLGWELGYHTYDSRRSQAGFPDLVLLSTRRRRLVMAELKKQTGRVSAAQREWLDALDVAGIERHVWRPSDYLDDTVRTVLARENEREVLA